MPDIKPMVFNLFSKFVINCSLLRRQYRYRNRNTRRLINEKIEEIKVSLQLCQLVLNTFFLYIRFVNADFRLSSPVLQTLAHAGMD